MARIALLLAAAAFVCLAQNTSGLPKGAATAEPVRTNRQAVLTTAQIAKLVSPSVVVIQGKTDSGDVLGSGFIASKDGKIVTNLHVIRDMKTSKVQLANGEIFDTALVLATDERRDLAILKIAGFDLPVLELGNSDALAVGEPAVIVGSPQGLEGTVTAGILSSIRHSGDGFKILQTDAAVNPGNSGGPLVNNKGQVVGVVSFKLRSSENLNFAIPINYVRGLLNNLHEPMSLEQMRRTLVVIPPAEQSGGPSLKGTLDWLKEKVPIGATEWIELTGSNRTVKFDRQSTAWSLDSCTVVIGVTDVATTTTLLNRSVDNFVVTFRATLPLSTVTHAFTAQTVNTTPPSTFLGGERTAYNVVLSSEPLKFSVFESSSDPQLQSSSFSVDQVALPFNDEQLAIRVANAFKRAADLCRNREAF